MNKKKDDVSLESIEQVAAEWLVLQDRGLTPQRQLRFQDWLASDPRHRAVYGALAETWTLMGDARSARSWEEHAAPMSQVTTLGESAFSQVGAQRPPASEQARWKRYRTTAVMAMAAVLVLVGIGVWRVEAMKHRSFGAQVSTDVGLTREVDLPDGSVMHLNTDSSVEVRFTERERRILLSRGEVYFAVAKQASRPFVVQARGVDVKAVGTAFNVRLRDEAVDVLVTEGVVKVATPMTLSETEKAVGAPVAAGEALRIVDVAPNGEETRLAWVAVPVAAPKIKQALAWQENRLDFDETPLGEVVAELNRYSRHRLVIGDAQLESQRFGGSLPVSDYLTFVKMLETNFGVVAERNAEETILRVRR